MKVAMALEGGAMRGIFSVGVLDVLMENNIEIDKIIGTSAGALFGINYFSHQKHRVLDYTLKYAKDKRYISIRNLLLTGNIVSKKFAFYEVQGKLCKFDNEEFLKTNKEFEATSTNIENGKCEYLKITNPFKDVEKLRATSAVPLVSKVVKIGDKKYLDGAISCSIPYKKLIDEGYDKIIVVLTRPINYTKKPLSKGKIRLTKLRYRKYPLFVNAMLNRYKVYNESLEEIKKLEKEKKIFVIRPSKELELGIIERDTNKLKNAYNEGVNTTNNIINKLKEYLNE